MSILKKEVYLFDIDGTLTDAQDRVHHVASNGVKDYESFYQKCDEDALIESTFDIMMSLISTGENVHLLTGRPERVRNKTIKYFQHFNLDIDSSGILLTMRPDKYFKKAAVFKKGVFDKLYTGDSQFRIKAVFEDDLSVVNMWRENGIQCYHVGGGDF